MIRSLLSATSLLLLAGLCLPQPHEQGPPVSAPVQNPSIKVESRIVVVDVVVTDKQEPDSSRAQRSDTQLAPDDGRHLGAKDFYGVQHFFVRKGRDTHLECDARDAAKNFIHVKDLFRDRFSV